ncbi:MAG: hypothetical protein OHK0029_20780 [Armatimonadaceae bacterium]
MDDGIILLLVGLGFFVGWLIHFCRPVTWRDAEGPLISEDQKDHHQRWWWL